MEATLVALGVLAGAMALATAGLIKWAADAKSPISAGFVLFLLGMMVAMLGGALVYYLHPSSPTLIEGLWVASAAMSLSVLPLFLFILREVRRPAPSEGALPDPLRWRPAFGAAVVGLVLLNEFLMGWVFQLAYAPGSLTGLGLTPFLSAVLNSPWFLFTMSAEMAVTTFVLRPRLGAGFLPVLALQALIMFLSPTALASTVLVTTALRLPSLTLVPWSGVVWTSTPFTLTWAAFTIVAGSVAMIALFVYQMEYVYRHPELPHALARYLVLLVGVYGLMMAGLYVWFTYADARLFAASILLEMVLYLSAVLEPDRFTSDDRFPWQRNARWAFLLLSGIFVAEFFMGALLDLQLESAAYAPLLPALPLSGSASTIAANALSNGFWFIAVVAGSSWFLIMMGAEMGALVVFKIRESKNGENRLRMGLMVASYAAFVVFFPSVYYSAIVTSTSYQGTSVPVLGWSMGIGSAPVGPSVFLVIFLTYAATGVLCFLFGRRVICSVFCSAPLMYQGTAIDAMSTFNRHSWPGKKYLGSRFSTAYTATTGLVMGSLVVASFLSYYDTLGVLNVYVDGVDPTVFLFTLSFSVAWYLMFVTIPYTGNYNCVTMGWCYTGTIAQAFQKLGPYKLKVQDKAVCKACTTLDCAKSCPVGLVDMPGHFRTTGEFRSSKCCGVGNCVGACPYGNLYIYDVRHWVRERLGRPLAPPAGQRLRVLSSRPGPGAATGPTSATAHLEPVPAVAPQP